MHAFYGTLVQRALRSDHAGLFSILPGFMSHLRASGGLASLAGQTSHKLSHFALKYPSSQFLQSDLSVFNCFVHHDPSVDVYTQCIGGDKSDTANLREYTAAKSVRSIGHHSRMDTLGAEHILCAYDVPSIAMPPQMHCRGGTPGSTT